MDFSRLLIKFAIFVVMMLIGYYYSRKGLVGPEFARSAGKLTLDVFMSASIVNSVVANPPQMGGRDMLWALMIVTIAIFIGYALSAAIVRLLPGQRRDGPVLELLMSVPNVMFIALPVVQQVLGSQAVFYIALSNLPFNAFLYTYGIWRLKGGRGASLRVKDLISVPLIATLLSVLIFALRLDMPLMVEELLSSMSGATMPLSMLVIGATLGSVSPGEALKARHSYLVAAVRLVVAPLLVYFLVGLLTQDAALRMAATIIAACPSGIIVTVLALQYGHDPVYSSKGILTSTALSMLTIPALVYILM